MNILRPLIVCLLVAFAVCTSGTANAQKSASTKAKSEADSTKGVFTALPVIYYTPETRLALGATALYFFRFAADSGQSRPSNVQVLGAYTFNKQVIFNLPYQLFLQREKYWLRGQLAYYRYPYIFNGIGNDVPAGYAEDYSASFPRFWIKALQRIRPNLYVGVRYQFQHTTLYKTQDSVQTELGIVPGQLAIGEAPGSSGGTTSGIGLAINYDTRDNLFVPTKGVFIQLSNLHHSRSTFSSFSFDNYLVDLRGYQRIIGQHVLALQAFGEWNYGYLPFNRMAQLGGPNRMRGYLLGTFRDKKLLTFQTEYRSPYFRQMGLAAFIGYGGVADRGRDFATEHMHFSYGAGWRWKLSPDQDVNFRLDLGFTDQGERQLYVTFNEAF